MTIGTRNLELDTPDGTMPTFEATPDGMARGGVVVVQEAFGVTRHIERVCERLATAGWTAIAPALFHRQGSPVFAYDTDFSEIRQVMGGLGREGLTADLAAAFDHLVSAGFSGRRRGIIGFCMGGAVALFAGTEHDLGAAVTFYGGGVREGRFGLPSLIELAPSLKTPWFGAYGDRDGGIASTTSRRCGSQRRRPPSRPRSSAMPTPSTASTATIGRPSTTPRPPLTRGRARSASSTRISPERRRRPALARAAASLRHTRRAAWSSGAPSGPPVRSHPRV